MRNGDKGATGSDEIGDKDCETNITVIIKMTKMCSC